MLLIFVYAHKLNISAYSATADYRNVARVRAALTAVCKRHAEDLTVQRGKHVRPRYFLKGRGSRHYPRYQCAKRCFVLARPTLLHFRSPEAKEHAGTGHAEQFGQLYKLVVERHGAYLAHLRTCSFLLRPLMRMLRLADGTRHNLFPTLMLRLVDLRSQCVNAWVDHADVLRRVHAQGDEGLGEGKNLTVTLFQQCYKKLANQWVLAAHLLEPNHVVLAATERRERGPLQLETDFPRSNTLPSGLDDTRLHRTLLYYARRALTRIAEALWPGTDGETRRQNFRRQLDAYIARSGTFDADRIPHWWADADFDAFSKFGEERPVPLWDLWARDDPNAPELQHVMCRLAACWPNQSSVERANGLIEFTTGAKRRNRLALPHRVDAALVADRFGRERRMKEDAPRLASPLLWAPGRPLSKHLAAMDSGSEDEAPADAADLDAHMTGPMVDDNEEWSSESENSSSDSASTREEDLP